MCFPIFGFPKLKKKFDKTVRENGRNRNRARRVSEGDKGYIPKVGRVGKTLTPPNVVRQRYLDNEVGLICAKCDKAGRYMLIEKEVEFWFCMEHYFSH